MPAPKGRSVDRRQRTEALRAGGESSGSLMVCSLLEPAHAPTGVQTNVVNSTVTVRWSEAQDVRGLLLGYKVALMNVGGRAGCRTAPAP